MTCCADAHAPRELASGCGVPAAAVAAAVASSDVAAGQGVAAGSGAAVAAAATGEVAWAGGRLCSHSDPG